MAFPHHHVTAFDPLIDHYEHDLVHFKKVRYANVSFYQSDLEHFNPEQQFDVVFCMNAINHVHDIQASFNQLHAYGKPGSVLVITIDAHTHTIFKKLFRLLPGDILHPHQHDLNEYQQMLLKLGYELLGTELLKHTFLFDHYMLIAKKSNNN
jgi:2-polyprenyl-6-hydroxyphenyl methylase/3-demethylubiquinone-9 3-methyltransferase